MIFSATLLCGVALLVKEYDGAYIIFKRYFKTIFWSNGIGKH